MVECSHQSGKPKPGSNYRVHKIQCGSMTSIQEKPNLPVQAVNFHLLMACNMACGHCFASNISPKCMPVEDAIKMIEMISQAGFVKINFAGGEPTLYEKLDILIRVAKENGMTTSVVSNGARITDAWLDGMSEHLDWIALSIDSANPDTHMRSGRVTRDGAIQTEKYLKMCRSIRRRGIRLKINTVVTGHNRDENITGFIMEAAPERWKIMQALTVMGQNDHNAELFEVTGEQFDAYVKRNRSVGDIIVVPESNDLMTGSYVMIDPAGRFFDNTKGCHTYSRPILQVGVPSAMQDVKIDPERFGLRGGYYGW